MLCVVCTVGYLDMGIPRRVKKKVLYVTCIFWIGPPFAPPPPVPPPKQKGYQSAPL